MNQPKGTHRAQSGAEISDNLAKQLADEAEAGYDLRQGHVAHIGRGRPSLSGKETSPQVTIRIPTQLRVKADQRAHHEGRTVSALAREALERYLAA
ncbi:MAG: hypothetical protein ACRDPW_08265 [Mycobacteriales bacterium]